MKESKKIVSKEIECMKKGGAPKSLIKHEREEHEQMKAEAKEKVMKKAKSQFKGKNY